MGTRRRRHARRGDHGIRVLPFAQAALGIRLDQKNEQPRRLPTDADPDKTWVRTLSLEPGSRWKSGDMESLNGKRLEHDSGVRPHGALGYRALAPEAIAAERPSPSLRTIRYRLPGRMIPA